MNKVLYGRIAFGESEYKVPKVKNTAGLAGMTVGNFASVGIDFDGFFNGLKGYKGEILILRQSRENDGRLITELRYGMEVVVEEQKKFRLISAYKREETPIIEERFSTKGKPLKSKVTYKTIEYASVNLKARDIYDELIKYSKKVKPKERGPVTIDDDLLVRSPIDWKVQKDECKGDIYTNRDNFFELVQFLGAKLVLDLKAYPYKKALREIEYVLLNQTSDVPGIRPLAEIFLLKDLKNLLKKNWLIINTDSEAEKFFDMLECYDGPISFDLETTGLNINMFGKYGSPYRDAYEAAVEAGRCTKKIDKVVGVVLTVETGVSYYFPCGHLGFKNLYEGESKYKDAIIERLKQRIQTKNSDTPDIDYFIRQRIEAGLQIPLDVILMERLRFVIENKHLVIQNITYEWKCCHLYDITVGRFGKCDDPSIMHKLTEKFIGNRADPRWDSDLKSMTLTYLNENQMHLTDIFIKESDIDFAIVPYEHARLYAPADGDFTLGLYRHFKNNIMTQSKYNRLSYLYNIECDVARAGGYVEFYGYRFNEESMAEALDETEVKRIFLETQLRQVCFPEVAETILKGEYQEYLRLEGLQTAGTAIKFADCQELRAMIDASEIKVNFGSPVQMAKIFYDKLGYPMEEGYTVKEKVIAPLTKKKDREGNPKYPAINIYMPYKSCCTEIQKFFGNLPDFIWLDGHAFSSFGLIDTATGRMSSWGPNAQQFPKSVTKRVIARQKSVMLDADYSQIEARLMLSMAKDPAAKAFQDYDMDIHKFMASIINKVPYGEVTKEMRSRAKSVTFGLAYGMGLGGMAGSLGYNDPTPEELKEAQKVIDTYFEGFPQLKAFFDGAKDFARNNMHSLTYFGRVRHLNFLDSHGKRVSNRLVGQLERQAMNTPIQGTAADCFKIALVRVYKFIEEYFLFGLLNVSDLIHDEMLFEVNTSALNIKKVVAEVAKCMEFEIPDFAPQYTGAGIDFNWDDAKSPKCEIYTGDMQEIIKKTWTEGSLFKNPEITTLREALQDEVKDTSSNVVKYFQQFNKERRLARIYGWYEKAVAEHAPMSDALLSLLQLIHDMYYPKIEKSSLLNLDVINAVLVDKQIAPISLFDYNIGYGEPEELLRVLESILGESLTPDNLSGILLGLQQDGSYRATMEQVLEEATKNKEVKTVEVEEADYTPSEYDPTEDEFAAML